MDVEEDASVFRYYYVGDAPLNDSAQELTEGTNDYKSGQWRIYGTYAASGL